MSHYSTAQSLTILSGPGNNVSSDWTREHHKMSVTSANLHSDSDVARSSRIPAGCFHPINQEQNEELFCTSSLVLGLGFIALEYSIMMVVQELLKNLTSIVK